MKLFFVLNYSWQNCAKTSRFISLTDKWGLSTKDNTVKRVIIVRIKSEYFHPIVGACNVELSLRVELFGLGSGKMSEMRNSVVSGAPILIKKSPEARKKIMKKKRKVYFNWIFMRVSDMVKLLGNVPILIMSRISLCHCWKTA